MAYDHEEQEQLEALKAWWKQYGNLVTWFLIVVLAAFSGWKAWGIYQVKQSVQASMIFEEMQKAIQSKDQAKLLSKAAEVQQNYSGSYYAQMAGLLAAKYAFEANDLKTAKAQLSWVQDHGKTDEFRALAKIRMAAILLDEKSYDAALNMLAGDFPAELSGMVADGKGDILIAQNKIEEARAAYQLALDKSSEKNPGYQLIQLKLDAIGGSKPKAANK